MDKIKKQMMAIKREFDALPERIVTNLMDVFAKNKGNLIALNTAYAVHSNDNIKKNKAFNLFNKLNDEQKHQAFVAMASLLVEAKEDIIEKYKQERSVQARYAASIKYKNNKKQDAKAEVKEHWLAWQKDPSQYKSAAAFAAVMMDKFNETKNEKPTLESQAVITRWCTQWKKEQNNTHPA